MHKVFIAFVAVTATVFGAFALAGGASATQGGGGHTAVTLCHRTGSTDGGNQHNGYDIITVDITSAGQAATARGHNSHEQVGNGPGPDIIPAYEYVGRDGSVFDYPGKGLDFVFANGETGAEVLAAGCTFAESTPTPTTPPPTTPPPSVTPPVISPVAAIAAKCADRATVTLDNRASVDGSSDTGSVTFDLSLNGNVESSITVAAGAIKTGRIGPLSQGDVLTVTANGKTLARARVTFRGCGAGPGPEVPPSNPTTPTPPSEANPGELAHTL